MYSEPEHNNANSNALIHSTRIFRISDNNYLPEVLEKYILKYSGLHELLVLSITNKASSELVLNSAKKILTLYFSQRRASLLNIIPRSFSYDRAGAQYRVFKYENIECMACV